MEPRFHKKHALGQNFLVNQGVITASLSRAALTREDVVLEIGPGQGALTHKLLAEPYAHLHLIEFDRSLEPWLIPLTQNPNLTLTWGDALAVDFASLTPSPTAVVANIPYHITTPLIWRLYAQLGPLALTRMILLVQKEAAERLTAPPGTKQRYPLGVTVQACGRGSLFMKVSPGSFNPPPKVDSALIELNITGNACLAGDPLWRSLLGHSFAQRRKTLVKSASAGGWSKEELQKLLAELGLPALVRAEELTTDQWLALYTRLKEARLPFPKPPHKMEAHS